MCLYRPITMTISSMPLFSIPQCKEPMTLSPTNPHILPLSLCNLISQRSHIFCSPFPCLFMSSCHIYRPCIHHFVIPKIRHWRGGWSITLCIRHLNHVIFIIMARLSLLCVGRWIHGGISWNCSFVFLAHVLYASKWMQGLCILLHRVVVLFCLLFIHILLFQLCAPMTHILPFQANIWCKWKTQACHVLPNTHTRTHAHTFSLCWRGENKIIPCASPNVGVYNQLRSSCLAKCGDHQLH